MKLEYLPEIQPTISTVNQHTNAGDVFIDLAGHDDSEGPKIRSSISPHTALYIGADGDPQTIIVNGQKLQEGDQYADRQVSDAVFDLMANAHRPVALERPSAIKD